jgi:hypothetical protein
MSVGRVVGQCWVGGGGGELNPGSCRTVHLHGVPALPSFRDFGQVGVLCTFKLDTSSRNSFDFQKLTAEQLLVRAGGTVFQSSPAHYSTNHRPHPLLQQGWARSRVGSILYGLRPLWFESNPLNQSSRSTFDDDLCVLF